MLRMIPMYFTAVIWHLCKGWSMVSTLNQCLIPNIEIPLMGLTKKSEVMITHNKTSILIQTKALLDSGANVIFIDRKWAEEKGLPRWPLCHSISVYNVDRTKNSTGQITHCTDVTITYQGHKEQVTMEITDLERNQMILGYMWLKCHNPEIDWETGTIKMTQCPKMCQHFRRSTMRFLAQLEAEEQENAWHAILGLPQKSYPWKLRKPWKN